MLCVFIQFRPLEGNSTCSWMELQKSEYLQHVATVLALEFVLNLDSALFWLYTSSRLGWLCQRSASLRNVVLGLWPRDWLTSLLLYFGIRTWGARLTTQVHAPCARALGQKSCLLASVYVRLLVRSRTDEAGILVEVCTSTKTFHTLLTTEHFHSLAQDDPRA